MMAENTMAAKAEMLIRKPANEVFEAFINPDITTKFWFTKSSGRVEAGQQVEWTWEMYGVSSKVQVKAVEANRRILIEWDGYNAPETVEWTFTARPDNTTFVSIVNNISGTGDEAVSAAISSTEAFTMVLCGAKALLEHGIRLNLVADRFPDGIPAE
jgi:uncharacterized protein YndB with AHSA1/START domain